MKDPESTHALRGEFAFLMKDVAWFEARIQEGGEDADAALRPVWMALSLRLEEMRTTPSDETAGAIEALVTRLERSLPEEAELMDVLRWQSVVLRKSAEGHDALVQRMMKHVDAEDPALHTFLTQLIQLGFRDEALGSIWSFAKNSALKS